MVFREKKDLASHVLDNNGSRDQLVAQVVKLHWKEAIAVQEISWKRISCVAWFGSFLTGASIPWSSLSCLPLCGAVGNWRRPSCFLCWISHLSFSCFSSSSFPISRVFLLTSTVENPWWFEQVLPWPLRWRFGPRAKYPLATLLTLAQWCIYWFCPQCDRPWLLVRYPKISLERLWGLYLQGVVAGTLMVPLLEALLLKFFGIRNVFLLVVLSYF